MSDRNWELAIRERLRALLGAALATQRAVSFDSRRFTALASRSFDPYCVIRQIGADRQIDPFGEFISALANVATRADDRSAILYGEAKTGRCAPTAFLRPLTVKALVLMARSSATALHLPSQTLPLAPARTRGNEHRVLV